MNFSCLLGEPMTTLGIANRNMLYSLSWYMSARKTAIRAALSFRTPLSVTDQTDLRVHYSSITVARFFEGVPALLRLDEPFATSTKR